MKRAMEGAGAGRCAEGRGDGSIGGCLAVGVDRYIKSIKPHNRQGARQHGAQGQMYVDRPGGGGGRGHGQREQEEGSSSVAVVGRTRGAKPPAATPARPPAHGHDGVAGRQGKGRAAGGFRVSFKYIWKPPIEIEAPINTNQPHPPTTPQTSTRPSPSPPPPGHPSSPRPRSHSRAACTWPTATRAAGGASRCVFSIKFYIMDGDRGATCSGRVGSSLRLVPPPLSLLGPTGVYMYTYNPPYPTPDTYSSRPTRPPSRPSRTWRRTRGRNYPIWQRSRACCGARGCR